MTELLTAAQMRAIEQAAINSGEVTGLELMERAGQGVVDAIFEEWPEFRRVGETHRAVVLCGPGNNGGDGFVVARLLKEAGWEVEVFLYGDAGKLPPDARVNYERVSVVNQLADTAMSALCGASLIVDALFGTGLSRPPNDLHRILRDLCDCVDAGCGLPLVDRLQQDTPPVVAVDMPSGLCADSGKPFQDENTNVGAIQRGGSAAMAAADLTIAFHCPKLGHYLAQGSRHSGSVVVTDIGLRTDARGDLSFACMSVRHGNIGKHRGHKYSHGHAFILSGGVGYGGAARLAARGALRIGAGAVTLAPPPAALIENAAQLNAVMLTAIKDADTLADILQDKRINALCIGPGLGLNARAAELLRAALETTRPGPDPGPQTGGQGGGPGSGPGWGLVLDADALTLLSKDKTLFDKLHTKCILTPHAGEFARLFPDIAETLNAPAIKGPAYSKVDATRDAAKRAGCVVLFKGPDTVIADPSGRCSINASVYERSAPWLATAGSGDVLAGFITGLLARGFAPMQAAETGAYLHTECALHFGPGLIAEDIPEQLPHVFCKLGL